MVGLGIDELSMSRVAIPEVNARKILEEWLGTGLAPRSR
jgi:phosphoenolpyruvate-protein kinase (PTS system EI component)